MIDDLTNYQDLTLDDLAEGMEGEQDYRALKGQVSRTTNGVEVTEEFHSLSRRNRAKILHLMDREREWMEE